MPRTPTIWLRAQTGWYCTKVDGVTHKLSKDKAEARREFYKLMGGGAKPRPRARAEVRRLLDTYLDRTRPDKTPATHAVQLRILAAFAEKFGPRDAAGVRVHEVSDWLASQDTWCDSTRALAVTVVKAAFNWAAAQGHLAESPLKGLKRRKTRRRERVLSAVEMAALAAAASPDFRDFLSVLELTGCRPYSEAARLTAAGVDWANGRAVLKEHKNAAKGKGRIIYFPPALLSRLKELAARRPTGPLLVNRLGRPWVKDNVGHYARRLGRKLGLEPFTPMAYRHSFITNALLRGVPAEAVAELVGNSVPVIHAHYAHLAKVPDAMRAAALKAVT